MGAALVLLLVGVGALAAGVLIGRYYVPDDRQLRRSARHSRSYIRALSHLVARDYDTAVSELRQVVEENVDDTEPYFALGAIFRSRGEHERAIRVHQALAMRERDKKKLKQRAMYELGLDFRAAGMPRRATRALEDVLLDDAGHDGAVRVLAALYEEQGRFHEAAGLWQRIGKHKGEDTGHREHHLLVAAAQVALGHDDLESAQVWLEAAHKLEASTHLRAAEAELAAARGDHRGARDKLREALVSEPGLAPQLLPALIAAEQGLGGQGEAQSEAQSDDQVRARVRAVLDELDAPGAPRLELALIRAQLAPAEDQAALAARLVTQFPEALAARVMAGRLAGASGDPAAIRGALDGLVSDTGALAWTLRGRWQCGPCGARPASFSWRCGQCRRWGTLRMETGLEPPPLPPRERRAVPRGQRPEGLLGTSSDLPAATLDGAEVDYAGVRRSLLGRVGGWVTGVLHRDKDA